MIECRVPRVEVAHGQRAIGSRRNDVGNDLTAQRRLPVRFPKVLRKAEKESLLWAIDAREEEIK
jgi:hypothetical protein